MIFRSSIADQVDDFRISLTGSGEQVTLQAGDTKEPFMVPFSRDQVERALDDSTPNRISTDPLTSFGSTLFSSLFSGKVGRQLWEQFADAEAGNRGLRLRIVTSLERIQHLPWELLFDPSRRDFMSLSGRLALVRTRQEGYTDDPLPPLSQLRIFVAEADVHADMDTNKDLEILRKFAEANPGVVELDVLERATPQTLRDKLTTNSYDIFHFAGTGEVLPDGSKRGGLRQALRLWGSTSLDPLFSRHELGELLRKAGVRLAVLNADHSDWIARSLARYIPSAIGFRETIWTEGCLALCESLYPLLVSPIPLDLAVTAVRQAVDRRLPGTGQWCKIILYLQKPNGLLFLDPESAAGGSASVPKPEKHDKERAKLSGLLNVYERNLNAAVLSGSETVVDLRRKVDDLKRQIQTPGGESL
jgi:hypothetical protein